MAKITFDFALAEKAEQYPAHGWAINSQGVRILWLPIRRILLNVTKIRRAKGLPTPIEGNTQNTACFCIDTLLKLTKVCQELHRIVRTSNEHPADLDDTESLDKFRRTNEIAPLFIDLAYVYLRRFGDRLTTAIRPILFEHYSSAPRELKKLTDPNFDPSALNPLYNENKFNNTINQNLDWFTQLRGTSKENQKKGFRDALEHRVTKLMVFQERCKSHNGRVKITLQGIERDVNKQIDLLEQLHVINASLCQFLKGLCEAIEFDQSYDQWDSFIRPGFDEDYTGLWPAI